MTDNPLDLDDIKGFDPNLPLVLSDDIVGRYVAVGHASVQTVNGRTVLVLHAGADL